MTMYPAPVALAIVALQDKNRIYDFLWSYDAKVQKANQSELLYLHYHLSFVLDIVHIIVTLFSSTHGVCTWNSVFSNHLVSRPDVKGNTQFKGANSWSKY